jgi:hypothetical protein
MSDALLRRRSVDLVLVGNLGQRAHIVQVVPTDIDVEDAAVVVAARLLHFECRRIGASAFGELGFLSTTSTATLNVPPRGIVSDPDRPSRRTSAEMRHSLLQAQRKRCKQAAHISSLDDAQRARRRRAIKPATSRTHTQCCQRSAQQLRAAAT